jgi:predicted metal-dependent enzyme (double-stranded beta helix superfamily)
MHDLIENPPSDRPTARRSTALAWRDFCSAVGATVDAFPLARVPARVAALLPDLLSLDGLLTPEQQAAPQDGYGRNRVFICPGDRFSVLAMVWPPGISTPIHDHRDWCALGLYRGEIEETRYDPATVTARRATASPHATIRHRTGAVAHLPVDAPNIHRIHNPTEEVAISIHVYGGNCETRGPNLDRVYTLGP